MDNHFEVMWDLFRDIPSIEDPSISVLDYYYWLNKRCLLYTSIVCLLVGEKQSAKLPQETVEVAAEAAPQE